jgi:hypothetical protein
LLDLAGQRGLLDATEHLLQDGPRRPQPDRRRGVLALDQTLQRGRGAGPGVGQLPDGPVYHLGPGLVDLGPEGRLGQPAPHGAGRQAGLLGRLVRRGPARQCHHQQVVITFPAGRHDNLLPDSTLSAPPRLCLPLTV